jgi:hypothetical protein
MGRQAQCEETYNSLGQTQDSVPHQNNLLSTCHLSARLQANIQLAGLGGCSLGCGAGKGGQLSDITLADPGLFGVKLLV